MQLSYTLNEELVTFSAIQSIADALYADAAAIAANSTLNCSSTQQFNSTENLVRTLASSNAALPILFSATSRRIASATATDAASVVPPSVSAKPAKPGKASPVLEDIPWQPDQLCTLLVDLAAILVGDTELVCTWPQKGLVLPPQLQAYGKIQLRIQVQQTNTMSL